MGISSQISESYSNGFIDCKLKSLEKYNPKLLVNNYKKGMKVLTSIQNELVKCNEFYFSVAFITNSGVQSLLNTLDQLETKGIKGKIITSQYQNFTEPIALRRLLKYKNIQLKIVTEENFHAKGYIFKNSDNYSFIIGSSNLTQNALSLNKEWNLRLSSLENGAVMQSILKEFEYTFDNATTVEEKWIEQYEKIYSAIRQTQKQYFDLVDDAESKLYQLKKINPNKMQIEALNQLEAIRKDGKKKALIISATGTGKTYLSAFDVAKFKPKKFLFIVHRENIARAAMKSFKAVLGDNIKAGFLTGNEKSFDCDYTFTTIQTLSKDNILENFRRNYFDYIVIDEVHRAGASTYRKILNHFEPNFLLGMTATPERTDGYDIFKTFDYNIAYEIRLNKALEENMLVPFHYFGISEITVNGELLDNNADFKYLVCDERVNRIVEASNYYGWNGERVKGLIFCSRVSEAEELSKQLNNHGFKTIALGGESTEDQRESCIQRLEQENDENCLNYIITVDIFNEGVDIPAINQIIMLRPTQSAIIFVQQLGRGLRKAVQKEYLTVIDFIGNYSNNYLVPIALYGDRSFNKDTIRKLINTGSSTIPGCSTVNFDLITKEKIYKALDIASLSTLRELKKEYELMKYRLGREPMMIDFLEQGAREPYAFVSYSKSYYEFVQKVDQRNSEIMEPKLIRLLEFYSTEIMNTKRIEEAVILSLLKVKQHINVSEFNKIMVEKFNYTPSEKTLQSAISNLNGKFLKSSDAKKYEVVENIKMQENEIFMDKKYFEEINNGLFAKYLDDMARYAFKKYEGTYADDQFRDGFILYEKYSRKDVCRILNWEKNEESTIYGYRIKYNTCPIFVTYNKKYDTTESQQYDDSFVDSNSFNWMTRNKVTLNSKEAIQIKGYEESGLRILLFVKKSDAEGSDFYYMGDVTPKDFKETTIKNGKGKVLPIVNILFDMNDEVEDSIYNYFEK